LWVRLLPESTEIVGAHVNVSDGGILLRAHHRILVVVGLKGRRYRGRVVRAEAQDASTTEYAIALDEPIDETSMPRSGFLSEGSP
jgi:hypothetical protein